MAVRKKPIESKIKKLEEQIAKRNAQKTAIDQRLAEPEMYDQANKKELKTLLTRTKPSTQKNWNDWRWSGSNSRKRWNKCSSNPAPSVMLFATTYKL